MKTIHYATLLALAFVATACHQGTNALEQMQAVTQAYSDLTIGPLAQERFNREFAGRQGSIRFRAEIKKIYLRARLIDRANLNRSVPGLGDAFSGQFLAGLRLKVGKGADVLSAPIVSALDADAAVKATNDIEGFYGWCLAYSPVEIRGVPGWAATQAEKRKALNNGLSHPTGM